MDSQRDFVGYAQSPPDIRWPVTNDWLSILC